MNATDVVLFGSFAATLLGIARFHARALHIAITGLVVALIVRFTATDFDVVAHFEHEGKTLANLAGLLLGFAVLADHFERSHAPEHLTTLLPKGRAGAFLLLVLVAVLSSVLDNIAAALIGGAAALASFRSRVHVGYLAAIVAASNAGGAGSVIGDTTTTMLWIEGASPLTVARAALGAVVSLLFFGWIASGQQHALQPLEPKAETPPPIDGTRLLVVLAILGGAIGANLWLDFPAAGVWLAIALGATLRRPDWGVLRHATPGTIFLCCLVVTASLMPVRALPEPSLWTTAGLGVVSAFFDNIPLTKLAIDQGGYDHGLLAYAVGFGGSMLWFGSSAGVAISGAFPQAKSTAAWLRHGWHVAVGYGLGFAAMAAVFGWRP